MDLGADPGVAGRYAVLGAAFIVRLRTAPEPLIPLTILTDREVRLSVAANAFGWAPVVGLHIFLPIYLQNIVGFQPATAGLSVLMLAVALNISAGITGAILPTRVHYKRIPIAGMALAAGAVLLLAWRAPDVSMWEFQIAAADRMRLRHPAAIVIHGAAKQRIDPHLWVGGRDHAVFAQSVRHHADRRLRGAGALRRGFGRRQGGRPIFRRWLRSHLPGMRCELCGVAVVHHPAAKSRC